MRKIIFFLVLLCLPIILDADVIVPIDKTAKDLCEYKINKKCTIQIKKTFLNDGTFKWDVTGMQAGKTNVALNTLRISNTALFACEGIKMTTISTIKSKNKGKVFISFRKNYNQFIENFEKRKTNDSCPDIYIDEAKKDDDFDYDHYKLFNSTKYCKSCKKTEKEETSLEDIMPEPTDGHRLSKEDIEALINSGGISSINADGKEIGSCKKLIGDDLLKKTNMIFTLIRIITPIILITFGMLDFTKAIGQNDSDALQKAIKTFTKRAIICVIIFLIPTLVNFLMNITGISDGTCGI